MGQNQVKIGSESGLGGRFGGGRVQRGKSGWEGSVAPRKVLTCEPSRELQESLGPSGPEIPKKSEKGLPGPPAAGSQKVWKKSRSSPEKSGKSLENVSSGLFRDFFQTFWDPGAGRPFSDFWGISGPEGPKDSCSSSEEGPRKVLTPWIWTSGKMENRQTLA